jgi:integrase
MRKLTKSEQVRASEEYADMAGILNEVRRRYREQKGEAIQWADGSWHLRYYVDDPSGTDKRVKITEPLPVDKDAHPAQIESAKEKRMAAINTRYRAQRRSERIHPKDDMTLDGYWTTFYLPYLKDEMRWSTWSGMEKRWLHTLKKAVGHRLLRSFTAVDANNFFVDLAHKRLPNGKRGVNANTYKLIRSHLSGLFGHAASKGFVDQNPIAGMRVTARFRPAGATVAYTKEDRDAMLEAVPTVKGKLFFAFAAYAALRPSEIAALQWEIFNFEQSLFRVVDAAAYGEVVEGGGLKHPNSRRELALIEPIKSLLLQYREQCKKAKGYLFTRRNGKPVNHNVFVNYYIKPFAEKACPLWKGQGIYAGRRGNLTELFDQTGDIRRAFQVGGNTLAVAAKHYVKPITAQGKAGLEQIEADYLKRRTDKQSESTSNTESTS